MLKRMVRLIVVVALAVAGLGLTLSSLSATGNAAEECVSPGGEGGCFTKIQDALDAVDPGGTVRVMAGDYVENLEISKDVTLLGGYDDQTFSARTPRSSIIDGNEADKVIGIHSGLTVLIDGFTITGGASKGEGGAIGYGNADVTIHNNLIENNVSGTDPVETGQGGAIFAFGSAGTATITDNTIRNNHASIAGNPGVGGGMMLEELKAVVVTGNIIEDNVAARAGERGVGGGVVIANAQSLTFADNRIEGNIALLEGWSSATPQRVNARAGGVEIAGGEVENELFVIENNQIFSNTVAERVVVSGTDSFAEIDGGGMVIRDIEIVRVDGNEISGNRAAADMSISSTGGWGGGSSGGGLYIRKSATVTITNNVITNNSASGAQTVINAGSTSEGGGMSILDVQQASILTNTIEANTGVQHGSINAGAGDNYYPSGGGIFFNCWEQPACSTWLDNNHLVNNAGAYTLTVGAGDAGGGGYGGAINVLNQTAFLSDNIISDNVGRRTGAGGGDGGGGISANNGQIWMTRNQFHRNLGNSGSTSGTGAIQVGRSSVNSSNDIFANNGNAISGWDNAQITLVNDTLHANGRTAINVGLNSQLRIDNSIVTDHETGLNQGDGSSSVVGNYNLMDNDVNYGGGAGGGANDILGLKPAFVDETNGDYHLSSMSPAIDAGDNALAPARDYEGDDRPVDGNLDGDARADIGADEFVLTSVYLPAVLVE